MKRTRVIFLLALLLAFGFGLAQTQEALALPPCEGICVLPGACQSLCYCDSGFSPFVSTCYDCVFPGNPCLD